MKECLSILVQVSLLVLKQVRLLVTEVSCQIAAEKFTQSLISHMTSDKLSVSLSVSLLC